LTLSTKVAIPLASARQGVGSRSVSLSFSALENYGMGLALEISPLLHERNSCLTDVEDYPKTVRKESGTSVQAQ